MSFSYASVIETIQLTPRLRRITLQVDDPEALEVKPGGDCAVGSGGSQLLRATP
ncbi:MAG: hypothetical protein QOF88_7117 [Mycobacterium sp.]|jgi:NADPH-dependent ferric siderophore reductase|nr:hypothetical protein [Mycobacterium sp.]